MPEIKLYKYLPERYIDAMLIHGRLLFRNMSYFRKIEDAQRGDQEEGIHRDWPKHPVSLTVMRTGKEIRGDFSFVRRVKQDKIFLFCTSTLFSESLANEFGANHCVEITDVASFTNRIRKSLARKTFVERTLICGEVEYYDYHIAAQRNISDAKNLTLFKNSRFRHQSEYRFVFASKGGLHQKSSIVINASYSYQDEINAGIPRERYIDIGNMESIARLHKFK